jgi:N-methylhydantoinase A
VHERARLAAGAVLEGPAIIEDRGASIPVRPGHRASVGDRGIVFIDVAPEGAAARPAAREAAR